LGEKIYKTGFVLVFMDIEKIIIVDEN